MVRDFAKAASCLVSFKSMEDVRRNLTVAEQPPKERSPVRSHDAQDNTLFFGCGRERISSGYWRNFLVPGRLSECLNV